MDTSVKVKGVIPRVAPFFCWVLLACTAFPVYAGNEITQGQWKAVFDLPTDRYGHAVLGNTPEWGRLCVSRDSLTHCIELPQHQVFEDLVPRLVDVDLDGDLDAVVVESDQSYGASLVVYLWREAGLIRVSTPAIGTRYRWLAPVAVADLDQGGQIELAFIDRPHLAKTLRVFRYSDQALHELASLPGLTNHRIGDDFIVGGVRDCGGDLKLITADSDWQRVMATELRLGQLHTQPIGTLKRIEDVNLALGCP